MSYSVQNIRNVCLLGHGGNGKTALAESLLLMTGAIDRMGRAADGNTVCDYDQEEIKRQISLSTAIAPLEYKGCRINLLDTPGAFDFAGEVMEALRAAVENGAEKPPCSTIAGIRTAPRAATVAGPEPEIAPKKQETITHTIAIPPFLCPTQVSTKSISLREIPAFAMIFPDSTKNGIARRRNLLIPEYIFVATMVSEVPE